MSYLVLSSKPEEKIVLQVERDRKDIDLNIVLGDRTSSLAEVQTDSSVPVLGGLKLSLIDAENQKKFRLPTEITGILISDVEPKSQAEESGFQSGDVIIQIEDIEIKTFANIDAALKKYKEKYKRVYVNRYGQTILFVTQ